MLSVLQFLVRIEPWHLLAAGIAGVALCIGFGRTSIMGWIGATLCGAMALAGAAQMWNSYAAPPRIAVVTAKTVGSPGGDDRVEWRFADPHSIFLYSRHPGDALRIDGIKVLAKNFSDRPLSNLRAVVRSYKAGREMKMSLALDGRQVDAGEPQSVPPKSEFSLQYVIPSMVDERVPGLPEGEFLRVFGDLSFMFGYDTNQMFARLVSVAEIEQQLSRIEEAGQPPRENRLP